MMLLDYFGVLGWIFGKKGRNQQIWANFGVLRRDVGILRNSVGPHQGVAKRRLRPSSTPRHSKATPQRRPTPQRTGATPWRSTVHRHVLLSCFAIPLFRGLVHWTNEDPISV